MNRASASASSSAIREIPLAINDWRLYLEFMEVFISEVIDFREILFKDVLDRERAWKKSLKKGQSNI